MDKKIEAGDVVMLKSGGPSMTVEMLSQDTSAFEVAICSWFDGTTRYRAEFGIEAIVIDKREGGSVHVL